MEWVVSIVLSKAQRVFCVHHSHTKQQNKARKKPPTTYKSVECLHVRHLSTSRGNVLILCLNFAYNFVLIVPIKTEWTLINFEP